ncbi:MAG: hypothetical protein ACJAR1_001486 [Rubritalea sp.]|jgi:hypothetical protein
MDKTLTKRVWIMSIMVLVGLSLVWLIPDSGVFKESQLIAELPDKLVGRQGVKLKISTEERKILAKDTTFSRTRYFDESVNADSFIDISVVFSGKDINNSIHRPEVCLKAQGWNFESEKHVSITTEGMTIPFKEIVCFRPRQKNEHVPHKNLKGEIIVDRRVQYYTFVGSEEIVAGHYERTWEDIQMRLLKGTDQQWAYITISMDVTENAQDDTNRKRYFNNLNLAQTKSAVKEFQLRAMPVLLKY